LPDDALLAEADAMVTAHAGAGVASCKIERCEALELPAAEGRVYLADESGQTTGSFKVRGALLALGRLRARGVDRFVAASAGNHGAGVAFAARALGMRATVVVPAVAPRAKRDKIAGLGAEILVHDSPSYDEAEAAAQVMARERGIPFVSAYDDLAVVAGNGASLGFEIARALGRAPRVVLAPFGGGGLATGIACALAHAAGESLAERRRVWGVQTEASPSFAMSLERGAAVERFSASVPTLAEGLEGGIAQGAFARACAAVAGVLVVSEASVARAMAFAYRSLGRTIEGSAAVGLAAALEGGLSPADDGDVVVVLTGGNVDPERLERVLAEAEAC
jgi:threonine dehydratase